MSDIDLIEKYGGPAELARLLKFDMTSGVQRVFNWRSRGIPARIKLDHPELFGKAATPAKEKAVLRKGRQVGADRTAG